MIQCQTEAIICASLFKSHCSEVIQVKCMITLYYTGASFTHPITHMHMNHQCYYTIHQHMTVSEHRMWGCKYAYDNDNILFINIKACNIL